MALLQDEDEYLEQLELQNIDFVYQVFENMLRFVSEANCSVVFVNMNKVSLFSKFYDFVQAPTSRKGLGIYNFSPEEDVVKILLDLFRFLIRPNFKSVSQDQFLNFVFMRVPKTLSTST